MDTDHRWRPNVEPGDASMPLNMIQKTHSFLYLDWISTRVWESNLPYTNIEIPPDLATRLRERGSGESHESSPNCGAGPTLHSFWLEDKFMLEVINNHEWERYKKLDRAVDKPIQ